MTDWWWLLRNSFLIDGFEMIIAQHEGLGFTRALLSESMLELIVLDLYISVVLRTHLNVVQVFGNH